MCIYCDWYVRMCICVVVCNFHVAKFVDILITDWLGGEKPEVKEPEVKEPVIEDDSEEEEDSTESEESAESEESEGEADDEIVPEDKGKHLLLIFVIVFGVNEGDS